MCMHFSVKDWLCIISEGCLSYCGLLICFAWNGSSGETLIKAEGSGGLYALPSAVLGFTWLTSPGEKWRQERNASFSICAYSRILILKYAQKQPCWSFMFRNIYQCYLNLLLTRPILMVNLSQTLKKRLVLECRLMLPFYLLCSWMPLTSQELVLCILVVRK